MDTSQIVELSLMSVLLGSTLTVIIPTIVLGANIITFIRAYRDSKGSDVKTRVKNCKYGITLFTLECTVNILLIASYLRLMVQASIRIYSTTLGSAEDIQGHWSIIMYSGIINVGIWLICVAILTAIMRHIYAASIQIELLVRFADNPLFSSGVGIRVRNMANEGKLRYVLLITTAVVFGTVATLFLILMAATIVSLIVQGLDVTAASLIAILYIIGMIAVFITIFLCQVISGCTACGLMLRIKNPTEAIRQARVIMTINILAGIGGTIILLFRVFILLISSKVILDHIVVKMVGFYFEPIAGIIISLTNSYPLYSFTLRLINNYSTSKSSKGDIVMSDNLKYEHTSV